jgi:uncharacterized protein
LLKSGADVNARDNTGSTTLHKLAKHWKQPSVEVIRLLLKYGMDIDAEDKEGKTALQFASANKHEEIVEFLLESGAKSQEPSRHSRSSSRSSSSSSISSS